MADKPVGKPYSHVYIERGAAREDDERFRNRLRAYVDDLPYQWLEAIANWISKETGARVDYSNVHSHLTKCSLVDLLDNITHIFDVLSDMTATTKPRPEVRWLTFIQRCLRDENLGYVLDAKGGVHPAFDEEFDVGRRASLTALGLPRYSTARQFFEQGIADLKPPQDTRDAVRKTFEAVENVAKIMVPSISRLGSVEVEKQIKPVATKQLVGAERDATNQMLNALGDWVNACHQYRHAPGTQEPEPPSLELAIWMVSIGASHLRWLIGVDQQLLGS